MKIDRKIKYDWVRGELCCHLLLGQIPLLSLPASHWLCSPPACMPSQFPAQALPADLGVRSSSCSWKAGCWDALPGQCQPCSAPFPHPVLGSRSCLDALSSPAPLPARPCLPLLVTQWWVQDFWASPVLDFPKAPSGQLEPMEPSGMRAQCRTAVPCWPRSPFRLCRRSGMPQTCSPHLGRASA